MEWTFGVGKRAKVAKGKAREWGRDQSRKTKVDWLAY